MDYKQIRNNPLKVKEFSKRLFAKVDTNKNGFVSIDELAHLLNMVAKEIGSKV